MEGQEYYSLGQQRGLCLHWISPLLLWGNAPGDGWDGRAFPSCCSALLFPCTGGPLPALRVHLRGDAGADPRLHSAPGRAPSLFCRGRDPWPMQAPGGDTRSWAQEICHTPKMLGGCRREAGGAGTRQGEDFSAAELKAALGEEGLAATFISPAGNTVHAGRAGVLNRWSRTSSPSVLPCPHPHHPTLSLRALTCRLSS